MTPEPEHETCHLADPAELELATATVTAGLLRSSNGMPIVPIASSRQYDNTEKIFDLVVPIHALRSSLPSS